MFRDVPECSGMFHVPDFIDARLQLQSYFVYEIYLLLHLSRASRDVTANKTLK